MTNFNLTTRRLFSGALALFLLYLSIGVSIELQRIDSFLIISGAMIIAYLIGLIASIIEFKTIDIWPFRIRTNIYNEFDAFLSRKIPAKSIYDYDRPFALKNEKDKIYNYLATYVMVENYDSYNHCHKRYGIITDSIRTMFAAIFLTIEIQVVYLLLNWNANCSTFHFPYILMEVLFMMLLGLAYRNFLILEIQSIWRRWIVIKEKERKRPSEKYEGLDEFEYYL